MRGGGLRRENVMNKDKDVDKTRISTESYSEFFMIYKLSEEKTEN